MLGSGFLGKGLKATTKSRPDIYLDGLQKISNFNNPKIPVSRGQCRLTRMGWAILQPPTSVIGQLLPATGEYI